MVDLVRNNAPELYAELLWYMRVSSVREESRNGPVRTIPCPVVVGIERPNERMLFDPDRNANPFFHIAEAVWMLAGGQKIEWLQQFNKNYVNYAESTGVVHGAYGWRWKHHFNFDQIQRAINRLKVDPTDRRVVIGMWNPTVDLQAPEFQPIKDVPCNTMLMFRQLEDHLTMTVINRSNDLIWGMMGANVVHMTILQEIIAHNIGAKIGRYWVMSNNLHIYEPHWPLMETPHEEDLYRKEKLETMPIMGDWEDIHGDAQEIIYGNEPRGTGWMRFTAWPVIRAYLDKEDRTAWIKKIKSADIRRACELWVEWRQNEKEHNLGS